MDLQKLQAMGAFVSNRPVKRVVNLQRPIPAPESEWSDPDVPEFTGEFEDVSMDVFIKRTSSADQIFIGRVDAEDRSHAFVLRHVVDEAGVRVFESMEQVKTLTLWMFMPLATAVNEVIKATPKAKASIPETRSGSRSRSRSAAAARKSGKKR